MGIITRTLEADNADDWASLLSVAKSVGFDRMPGRLRSNWVHSSPLTTCYGVEQDGELVASVLYMAHDIRIGGVATKAFQSCWIMVRPEQQGGPWLGLIYRRAMRDLARLGAKFIFGFPMDHHIAMFTSVKITKVSVLPMRRTYMVLPLPGPLLQRQWSAERCRQQQSLPGLVRFEQAPIHAWKLHEHPGLVSIEDDKNFLWGRVEERRLGGLAPVKVLLAGGCEIGNPPTFMRLAGRMRGEHGITVIRFVSPEGSVVATAGRLGRAARKTESFTFIPLVKDLPEKIAFDVCTGLKGVF